MKGNISQARRSKTPMSKPGWRSWRNWCSQRTHWRRGGAWVSGLLAQLFS